MKRAGYFEGCQVMVAQLASNPPPRKSTRSTATSPMGDEYHLLNRAASSEPSVAEPSL